MRDLEGQVVLRAGPGLSVEVAEGQVGGGSSRIHLILLRLGISQSGRVFLAECAPSL